MKKILMAAFATALLAQKSSATDLPMPSSGTLIVGVPTTDGLIIAADTRRTMNGVGCDFGTKLHVPKNLPQTVFGFTGLSGFYAVPPSSRDCSELMTSPVLFNIEPTVRDFLEHQAEPVGQIDAVALANACVEAISKFLVDGGSMIDRSTLVARPSIFTVVLAGYEPETNTSVLREIAVRLRSPSEITAEQPVFDLFNPKRRPDWRAFGQGAYLVEHVINGVGKQFLTESYAKFERVASIGEVEAKLAIEVAETLIEATSKTSETVQIPVGVGGHIDVYFLSRDGTTKVK